MSLLKFISFIKIKALRINLLIFIIFSITMTLVAEKLPNCVYYYKNWLYKERKWENGGKIYERIFCVKKWKPIMPDISDFLKSRFSKKHLAENNVEYLSLFLSESCKSEFTHWMIIFSSFLFIFWSGVLGLIKILLIALLLNLPYIIIQRYNRPRIIRLIKKNSLQGVTLSPVKV